jgi:hypothetical protein
MYSFTSQISDTIPGNSIWKMTYRVERDFLIEWAYDLTANLFNWPAGLHSIQGHTDQGHNVISADKRRIILASREESRKYNYQNTFKNINYVGRPDPKGLPHLQSVHKVLSRQGIQTHVIGVRN